MNWRAKEGIRSESMDGLLQDITMNHSLLFTDCTLF